MMRACLLRAALLLLACCAARAGDENPHISAGGAAVVRLKLWRVRQAPRAKAVVSRWHDLHRWRLQPVTPPKVGDDQLYNYRDACVPCAPPAAAAAALSKRVHCPRNAPSGFVRACARPQQR
jgi:hypothetical protein